MLHRFPQSFLISRDLQHLRLDLSPEQRKALYPDAEAVWYRSHKKVFFSCKPFPLSFAEISRRLQLFEKQSIAGDLEVRRMLSSKASIGITEPIFLFIPRDFPPEIVIYGFTKTGWNSVRKAFSDTSSCNYFFNSVERQVITSSGRKFAFLGLPRAGGDLNSVKEEKLPKEIKRRCKQLVVSIVAENCLRAKKKKS